ncbi:MAG: adenylyltransferase/cytidyltransferase family protein [Geminicoccales bacterium]
MAPTTGFLLGKFLPPHRGHQYLIEFARAYVDRLSVLVCSIAREPIPGALRYRWMCESFPGVTLIDHTDEIPQAPEEHPQFWDIWRTSIRRYVPGRIDYVFASEDYGWRLAEELGARFVPVDIERRNVPVSGAAIRADPMTHWEALLPAVRPYYLKRVCIVDAHRPSLAERLAAELRTVCVHSPDGRRCANSPFDIRAQRAAEEALARQANRVLICEADAPTAALMRARCRPAADRPSISTWSRMPTRSHRRSPHEIFASNA